MLYNVAAPATVLDFDLSKCASILASTFIKVFIAGALRAAHPAIV
jgi:hypothetical protein